MHVHFPEVLTIHEEICEVYGGRNMQYWHMDRPPQLVFCFFYLLIHARFKAVSLRNHKK